MGECPLYVHEAWWLAEVAPLLSMSQPAEQFRAHRGSDFRPAIDPNLYSLV